MKTILKRFFQYFVIVVSSMFVLYPLLFTFITSLKTKEEYIQNPYGICGQELTFSNYQKILSNFNFLEKFTNSAFVVLISIFFIMILSIPSAYYLKKIKNLGIRTIIILFCFALMFVPEEVIILPEYNMMSKLGLINNFLSVIIIFVSSSLPEVIFLLYIYMALVPKEIIDAARLDGVNEMSCLLYVIIPILKAPIIVVTITTIISLWNSFLVPMLMLYEEEVKLLVPSLSGLITKHSTTPTYQMAGMFLSMIPIVITYIIFKKHIFENSIGGAIK